MPKGWQASQLWTEVFAWQFSLLVGIAVPRCFVGIDERGVPGAVIEFFFGYPNEAAPERFIHASDILQRSLIDKKRGRPHSVRSNADICRALQVPSAREWWAGTLAFDALIRNTDRRGTDCPRRAVQYDFARGIATEWPRQFRVLRGNSLAW
jgi:hypothetical protein